MNPSISVGKDEPLFNTSIKKKLPDFYIHEVTWVLGSASKKFLPQLAQRDSEAVAANTNRIVGQKLRAKQAQRVAQMFIWSSNF